MPLNFEEAPLSLICVRLRVMRWGARKQHSGEYLVEVYIAAGQAVTGQIGGVMWAALEYQSVVEIDNHGSDAKTIRPTITRLIN